MQHGILAAGNTSVGAHTQGSWLCRNVGINPFYNSLHLIHLLRVCDILPLNQEHIQLFQRNILPEDMPYFLAIIVSIFAYSFAEISPLERILRASAIAV